MEYYIDKEGEIFNSNRKIYPKGEEYLRNIEEKYKASVGIAIVKDGKFAFVNRALMEKLGCTHELDIIGKVILSFIHKDSLHKFWILLEHNEIGNKGQSMKGKLFRLNGSTFFAEFDTFPILFKGQPSFYLRITELYSEDEFNLIR